MFHLLPRRKHILQFSKATIFALVSLPAPHPSHSSRDALCWGGMWFTRAVSVWLWVLVPPFVPPQGGSRGKLPLLFCPSLAVFSCYVSFQTSSVGGGGGAVWPLFWLKLGFGYIPCPWTSAQGPSVFSGAPLALAVGSACHSITLPEPGFPPIVLSLAVVMFPSALQPVALPFPFPLQMTAPFYSGDTGDRLRRSSCLCHRAALPLTQICTEMHLSDLSCEHPGGP